MSWSLRTDQHPASGIRGAVEAIEPPVHVSGPQLDQIRQAKLTAIALLDSGIVGDADAERDDIYFVVALGGHAGATSAPGDSTSVTVTQSVAP